LKVHEGDGEGDVLFRCFDRGTVHVLKGSFSYASDAYWQEKVTVQYLAAGKEEGGRSTSKKRMQPDC
jgi:hypothetical protein